MDISSFMSWFITEVVSIFTYSYNLLNSIQFGGTSLLKVIIFINIIIPFLYLIITVTPTTGQVYEKGYRKGHKEYIKQKQTKKG